MTAALYGPVEAGCVISPQIQTDALQLACGAAIIALTGLFVIYLILIEHRITKAADGENEPMPEDADRSRGLDLRIWKLAIAETLSLRNERRISWAVAYLGALVAVVACGGLFFGPTVGIADLNIGLLFIVAVSSLGIFGLLLSSELSNGKVTEATLRGGAQWISFQIVAILGLISAVLFTGSFSLKEIVQAQSDQGAWFIFYAPVGFAIYFGALVMSSDRAASEIPGRPPRAVVPAGIESGLLRKVLSSLTGQLNMIVVAGIAATVFFGGWLRPFARYHDRFFGTQVELVDAFPALLFLALAGWCFWLAYGNDRKLQQRRARIAGGFCAAFAIVMSAALFASPETMAAIHGTFWFCAKVASLLYGFLWIRAMAPRSPFERGIRAAWRVLVPVATVNLILAACAISMTQLWDFGPGVSSFVTTLATVAFAAWLWSADGGRREPVTPAAPADVR